MEKDSKTAIAKRTGKYVINGVILTGFNFLIFTVLERTVFAGNDFLWVDTIISYTFATFLAYFLHSKITWRERNPGKIGIIKFFAWNFLAAFLISPLLTYLFGFFTPLYEFAFNVSSNLGLPFDYDLVESTVIFVLVTLIIMVLNYLFYDKIVFGSSNNLPSDEE